MIMSTQTLADGDSGVAGFRSKPASFFERVWQHILRAQEHRAAALVRDHLESLSDRQLAAFGYGPVAIKAIRKRAVARRAPWL
jgi:hypothetical protein